MRRWFSPPDRREITLILVSLCIFTLSYNLDSSLRLIGIEPLTAEGAVQSAFLSGLGGLGLPTHFVSVSGSKMIGRDGRKLPGRRDELENEVWGEWEWEVGYVARNRGDATKAKGGLKEKDNGQDVEDGDGDGERRKAEEGRKLRLNSEPRHDAYWLDENVRKEVVQQMWDRQTGQQALTTLSGVVGRDTADKGVLWWGDDVPSTKVLVHLPGHTILDNVILFNGRAYLVRDETSSNLPPLTEMVQASEFGVDLDEWTVVNKREASRILGDFAGIIRDVSWLSNDPTPHNSTLFSFWRLYTLLDQNLSRTGQTSLPQPRRLILPHTSPYSDPFHPDDQNGPHMTRTRSPIGFHPYLTKAILPKMGVLYKEDWEDFMKMDKPYLLERVVLVDRRVAVRMDGVMGRPGYGRLIEEGVHGFGMDGHSHAHSHGHEDEDGVAGEHEQDHDHSHDEDGDGEKFGEDGHDSSAQLWFEPIRKGLGAFLSLEDDSDAMNKRSKAGLLGDLFNKVSGKTKVAKVVTYIHTQGELYGTKLTKEDHEKLVDGLRKMVKHGEGTWNKWEVKVVSSVDWETGWSERLESIAKSSIVIGVHGSHLMDSVFMKRTPRSMLFELFPFDSFSREYEVAVKSIGLGYTAWSGSQKYTDDNLPPVSLIGDDNGVVSIDVDALLENVKEVLRQMS